MNNISYTASSHLKESLQKTDVLRRNILLTVLTPEHELRFRWQATMERIFWSLAFSTDTPLSKNEILKLFKEQHLKKPLTSPQQEVLAYKKGFDYIVQNWLGLQEPVTSKNVLFLHQIACSGRLHISQESLKLNLLYFQNSSEHPIIQAGLVYFQILTLSPFTDGNERLSRLLSYLFLYKEGFYCRGFLVLDEYFKRNFIDYQLIIKQAIQTGSQTLWLEYFAKGVAVQLEKTLEDITTGKARIKIPVSTFRLNERQKEILTILENPDTTITNRQIQKMFKISQITASRDLVRLASLGLLFTHGKGRSVYYTKV
ncbi:MAG: hypothetical protein COX78_03070 [Candidatus Levybacteria bacterium CG_4_10_14_0_2_um_filter_35_8]|nr:MAG: hypothetical protein COY68_02960 [Candidatus Levybacteria bacterium CG_4_10_14_0_8_um_filter_35_23]PIZ98533.1 MAG: hypothetical protein COX78_03070 [Candidatus Levybacteria bacterium CG_4_10_14_0_2_um_filter_35_8]